MLEPFTCKIILLLGGVAYNQTLFSIVTVLKSKIDCCAVDVKFIQDSTVKSAVVNPKSAVFATSMQSSAPSNCTDLSPYFLVDELVVTPSFKVNVCGFLVWPEFTPLTNIFV